MKPLKVPELSGASNELFGGSNDLHEKPQFIVVPSLVKSGLDQIIRTVVFFKDSELGMIQCAHMIIGCKSCDPTNPAPIDHRLLMPDDLDEKVKESLEDEEQKHVVAAYSGGLILSLPFDVENPVTIYHRGLAEHHALVLSDLDDSDITSLDTYRSRKPAIVEHIGFSAVAGQ